MRNIKKSVVSRLGREARGFVADEEGSFSIEAVVWMPIFAILIAVIMNV